MNRILGVLLTITMLLGCISVPLTGSAADAIKSMSEKNGVFSIEAESATINLNYTKGDDAQASGGKYLVTNLDSKEKPAKTDKGNLEFTFTPKITGKHYFWARINPTSVNKSIWLSIGDQEFAEMRLGGTANAWGWVKLKEFDAEAGKSTTVKFSTYIGYFKVDGFEISSDVSYAPSGASAVAPTPTPKATTAATATTKPTTPTKAVDMEQKGGAAFIEAEKTGMSGSDTSETADTGASGGKIVNISKDRYDTPDQSDSGALAFSFTPDADGSYTLWARVKPTTPNKSVWFAIGDIAYSDVALKGEKGVYHWAGITSFQGKKGEKVTVKIIQKAGYFAVDCFVIGANADKNVYTPNDKDFGLSGANVGAAPTVKATSKGLYPYVGNNIDKMTNGVALLIDTANAYANKKLQKVDSANEAVVPTVKNDRTLVPLRFIAESFGANVGWDEATQTASVTLDGKNISIALGKAEMVVDGKTAALDVAAETMNDRTMLPLRAVVEALGKNVFWDDRGLILITNKDTTIDKVADEKMVSIMVGYLKTGKLALNYAAYPHISQNVLDKCVDIKAFTYTASNNRAPNPATALYYLTLAARTDETITATNGTLAKDAALNLIRSLIAGGSEPAANFGIYWDHPVVSAALVLIKNTPVIYNELTQDDKERIDFLQKCFAIATNWGFNDENNYGTGFDMKGNAGKTWNPNHRTYLMNMVMATLHFGPEELDKILTSFNYDEYMAKLKEYGFTNTISVWSETGKDLMENGGPAFLKGTQGTNSQKVGDAAGTGKGVKIPFKYGGLGLNDIEGIFGKFIEACYKGVVANGHSDVAYIISGASSPMLGYEGMMFEFNAGDGNGVRSSAHYCYDSFLFVMPSLANLKMLGKWDSQSDIQKKYDTLMYTGNTDFIFKLTEGYQGFSLGSKNNPYYESSFVGQGYMISKALWQNFHSIDNNDITIVSAPAKAAVEPFNGITAPPAGSKVSSETLGNMFDPKSYFDLGKKYTGDVTAEFDLVFGNDIGGSFNGVVMFDEQGAKELTWSKVNVLIQCSGSKINIRNGSKYVYSEFDFAPNYRYHFKVKMNASKKTYSVWMNPTWPKAGAEKLVAENFAFREGANQIDNIGDLIMATEVGASGKFWVENMKLSE